MGLDLRGDIMTFEQWVREVSREANLPRDDHPKTIPVAFDYSEEDFEEEETVRPKAIKTYK